MSEKLFANEGIEILSKNKYVKKLQLKIRLLKAENELLKKLEMLERSVNKKN